MRKIRRRRRSGQRTQQLLDPATRSASISSESTSARAIRSDWISERSRSDAISAKGIRSETTYEPLGISALIYSEGPEPRNRWAPDPEMPNPYRMRTAATAAKWFGRPKHLRRTMTGLGPGAQHLLGTGYVVLCARELEGVSQSHFAFRVGTSQPTLSAYELGARIPTLRTLIRIANAGGFDLVIGLREASTAPHTSGIPTPLLGILRLGDEGLPAFTVLHEPRNAPSDLPQ